MFEQYTKLRREYPDTILLFRLGDFYEGFEDDAKTLSKVLGITLTGRGAEGNRMPMAGIPYHAINQYLPKLIKAGYKVAIAEQMEEAKPGQIVAREVTKVITAGTIIDEKNLEESENNYLASIYFQEKGRYQIWGLSFADLSTGEFKVCEYRFIADKEPVQGGIKSFPNELVIELNKIKPAEILINKELKEDIVKVASFAVIQGFDKNEYFESELHKSLLENLGADNFKGFGIDDMTSGIIAAGKLFEYINRNRKSSMPHINKISRLNYNDYMLLDEASIRNLELLYPIRGNDTSKTLYGVLNKCKTPMGQRLLRQWLLHPLIKKDRIQNLLNKVDAFFRNKDLLNLVIEHLSQITDLERVLGKISGKSANARDLLFLKSGLNESINVIKELQKSSDIKALKELIVDTSNLDDVKANVVDVIEKAITDNPSLILMEGNLIKDSYNQELDSIRKESEGGKTYIKNLEQQEIKRTGISSLKVRFNKVFGYYIEISRSNLNKVPEDYIRKQTLVNGERYITSELKEWESKILGAEEKTNFLEYKLFEEVRMQVLVKVEIMQKLISQIAEIDVITDFAILAQSNNYVKPEISDDVNQATSIEGSRHPVVESFMIEKFVSNDINFKPREQELIILTGPNMSGKSTYIRQIALIFLMCQIGCFVPADKASIVIADRVFTRVGASDNLAGGESTFMVEMNETANILNNATKKSLVILDEVGRGTSTFDGVAIAWAIVEQLVNKIGARCMFATHYHELIELADLYKQIKNFNIEVIEKSGKIYFMHKIIPGGTDKSYGIHVAQIAGIPDDVITRSHEIMDKLVIKAESEKPARKIKSDLREQMSLMLKEPKNKAIDEITALDINNLTPVDALNILKVIQEKIKDDN